MEFTQRHEFDKDSDAVIRMFTDRAYFERKYEEIAVAHEVLECEQDGDDFRIRCRVTVKSDVPLPGFAKKFMGETTDVIQEDRWNAATKTGRLTLELHGVPAELSADMALGDEGGKAVNTLNWKIRCAIPLVGGKLEKVLATDIEQKADRDVSVSNEILADY